MKIVHMTRPASRETYCGLVLMDKKRRSGFVCRKCSRISEQESRAWKRRYGVRE